MNRPIWIIYRKSKILNAIHHICKLGSEKKQKKTYRIGKVKIAGKKFQILLPMYITSPFTVKNLCLKKLIPCIWTKYIFKILALRVELGHHAIINSSDRFVWNFLGGSHLIIALVFRIHLSLQFLQTLLECVTQHGYTLVFDWLSFIKWPPLMLLAF